MNKTSNVAFEIAQDIYNLCGDLDKLFEVYGNHQISEQVYFKKLYVLACEANFLDGVVDAVKGLGYKFARYEKEVELLKSAIEEISDSLEIIKVASLKNSDIKNLIHLTNKYKEYVPVEDISEELSDC